MQYLDIHNIKTIFFAFPLMVIGSFNARADLPLPMASGDTKCLGNNFLNALTETQDVLLTGDSILLIGFLLWIAYIVFCFPKDTLKKL